MFTRLVGFKLLQLASSTAATTLNFRCWLFNCLPMISDYNKLQQQQQSNRSMDVDSTAPLR